MEAELINYPKNWNFPGKMGPGPLFLKAPSNSENSRRKKIWVLLY
jgi:hypothetical protein